MTTDPLTDRTTEIYDAIDAFQRTHRLPGLQHAQIRGLLAEYLARALPAAVSVPPPTRAALLWAADTVDAVPLPSGFTAGFDKGARWATEHLRRLADEAEFVASPCAPMALCEDGGEPCDVHERLMSHYDGSHELCAPDCETAAVPGRVADEETTTETRETECAHCWRLVENRGTPNMGGPPHDNWVHVPGGFQPCFPQKPNSPRAEPRS